MSKLEDGAPVTLAEVEILARQLTAPKATRGVGERRIYPGFKSINHIRNCALIPGFATETGSNLFTAKFGKGTCSFYNTAEGLRISNLGLGTHYGGADKKTDRNYFYAVCSAVSHGLNLLDTSINYRSQRSEIAVGNALHRLFKEYPYIREGLIICTKGGYLVPGAFSPKLPSLKKLSNVLHSIDPDFIDDQISRSRRNLGVKTIDIYYIHNPETQLRYGDQSAMMSDIQKAFERLEMNVSDGRIQYYGVATWSGLRHGHIKIEDLVAAANVVAGSRHRFRFVQLPVNLGMPEAIVSQGDDTRSIVKRAVDAGINVIASAALLRGRLSRDLPVAFQRLLPNMSSDAQRALQFARSAPGIVSALVGMRTEQHVLENLQLSRYSRLTPVEFKTGNFFDHYGD